MGNTDQETTDLSTFDPNLSDVKLADLSETDALSLWKKLQANPLYTKPDAIKLYNQPFLDEEDEEGKPIPDPKFGKLYAQRFSINKDTEQVEEEEEEIDIKKAEFHAVYFRMQATPKAFDTFYIPEVDEFRPITIYYRDTKEVAAEGNYKDLKDEYELKYNVIVYVLLDNSDEIYRWKITPSSFGNRDAKVDNGWFALRKALQKAEQPMTFKVSNLRQEKNGSTRYYAMEFEVANPFDPKRSIEKSVTIRNMVHKEVEGSDEEAGEAEVGEVVDKVPATQTTVDKSIKKKKDDQDPAEAVIEELDEENTDLPF